MLLFINVDGEGNIIDALYGKNIIPEVSYDFFFLVDEATIENIMDYKVVIIGFQPKLVRKDDEGAY